ncbi:MAG: phage tail protein [Solirubrobacteraceae bacterium]
MAEPFLGEIRTFGFGITPRNWAPCQGQLLPINRYQALFALLGTIYGGDGRTTFGLPDLRGRVAVSAAPGMLPGQTAGVESVTLNLHQVPAHTHMIDASPNTASKPVPKENYLAKSPGKPYVKSPPPAKTTTLHPSTITPQGGQQPHENRQPYLALNFCIALQGIFPSRS